MLGLVHQSVATCRKIHTIVILILVIVIVIVIVLTLGLRIGTAAATTIPILHRMHHTMDSWTVAVHTNTLAAFLQEVDEHFYTTGGIY